MATTYTDKLVVVDSGVIKKVAADDSLILSGNLELGPAATLTIQSTGSIQHLNVLENLDVTGNAIVAGNLTVNGTTTTINSTTISVDDINIELGSVDTPSELTADGGGIILKGGSDHTILWTNSTDSWDFSEHVNAASGKEFKINNTSVLSATTLGSTVVGSSLTSVGTIGTGVWQGTAIADAYVANDLTIAGGTVNNSVIGGTTPAAGTFTALTGTQGPHQLGGDIVDISDHDGGTKGLQLGGTLVTSTAAELNVLDGVTSFLDEDDMFSDSATGIASQQSIKAYVDSQVTSGAVASAQGILSGSDVVLQSTNGSIELVAPDGVGQEYTGFYIETSNHPQGKVLSGSIVAISNNVGKEGYLMPADNYSHSYAVGVTTKDLTNLVPDIVNTTASVMIHTLPGIQVPVLFNTPPTGSVDQGKFCYLTSAGDLGGVGRATLTVPSANNIIRLGVLASTASDGGLYNVFWQPQFIASL